MTTTEAPGRRSAVLSDGAQPTVSLVVTWDQGMPTIVHWGAPIGAFPLGLIDRPVPRGGLDIDAPLGLVIEESGGIGARPGVSGSRATGGWSPRFALRGEPSVTARSASFDLVDVVAGLELAVTVRFGPASELLIETSIVNVGDDEYRLDLLAPSIPLPAQAVELLSFDERWCLEFGIDRGPWRGRRVIENRRARTSHSHLPAVFAGTAGFSETSGEVWAAQLAWSGNFTIATEALVDGRRHLQLGELLGPGEVVLAPGERYQAPDVVGAWSPAGTNGASQVFHRHVRSHRPQPLRPRPVNLNTWEAVYFDHDLDTLCRLADAGAEVGAERFVLDDGWFGSRRDDTSGLGDWWVSPDVWPAGLDPLIRHVTGLGMEFGLWVEPEMVNPDSDLYREHPDWILATPGYEPLRGRHQFVLDFGRSEVRDHLFGLLDRLLAEHDITSFKWDMNRDVIQGSGSNGAPGTHAHVIGLYEVIDRLRAAHPGIEIESCSSGGGRADLGILRRTQRIWASDCNDAIDRQLIQRGFSMLFPPEVMGAHVGPPHSHTTGRRQPLGFRLATAMFGHFGFEWNLLEASPRDRDRIRRAVDHHKRLRSLLHGGDVVRLDHPDPAVIGHGVVSLDRDEAVFAVAKVATSATSVGLPVRFAGLDPDRRYHVGVIDDFGSHRDFGRTTPAWIQRPTEATGRQLTEIGLQPPVMHPESVLLVHLTPS